MSSRINTPLNRRLRAMSLISFLALVGLLSLFWLMGAWPSLAAPDADIYYVTTSGSGASCTQAAPCTLPTALSQATTAGDEIRVAEGLYENPATAPVLTVTQSITVSGGFNPPDWENSDLDLYPTYLDGGGNGRVVEIQGNIAPTIQGFHVRNGDTPNPGAGIYNNSGSPLIQNNRIYDNITSNEGGGVFDGGSAALIGNYIHNNTGSFGGGGVLIDNGGSVTTTLEANEIYSNTTNSLAGGLYIRGGARLERNRIYQNQAPLFGGIYLSSGSAQLYSNFIYENEATNSVGGISIVGTAVLWNNTIAANVAANDVGAMEIDSTATVQMSNNIIALNDGGTGSIDGVDDLGSSAISGSHNNILDAGDSLGLPDTTTTDPGFLSAGNYHLAETSGNVDSGDPNTPAFINLDIDGQTRPNGTAVDRGADEFYPNLPAFSLTPESRSDGVDRGTAVTYNHALENEGTVEDTYAFTCVNADWSVDTCPDPVTLQPGENTAVQTIIQVPAAANAFDQATTIITATSTYSSELTHRAVAIATVNPVPGVAFTPSYSETVLPGETITFTHRLTNSGDALDTFTVQLTAGDWAELLPRDQFQLEIPSGDARTVQVRVTVPPQAPAGLANETRIRASSDFDPAITAVVTDTVTARPTIGTRYVSTGGDDADNNCTQVDAPCATIARAVGQASFEDEIHIAAGTYPENGISLNDTIYLSGGWVSNFRTQDEPTATVIDAAAATRIFDIAPGAPVQPGISNMTLQNGQAGGPGGAVRVGDFAQPRFEDVIFLDNQGTDGGAIYAGANANVRIRSSQFFSNTGTSEGGAVYGDGATLSIQQSTFMTNDAAISGGALYINAGLLQAQNNLFSANQAAADGGAVAIQDAVQATLGNNTLVNNSAGGQGGAVYNNLADLILVNDLFVGNVATDGGAVYQTGNGSATLSYSDVWNNSASETIGVTEGMGNFSADPLFADDQFRLARRSPALDAGDPATTLLVDFEDDARPADQGFDVGYDELAGCRAQRDGVVYGSIQEAIEVPGAESDLIRVSGICRGVHTIQVDGRTISQTVHLTESLTIQGGWNSEFSNRTFQPTFIDPEGAGRGVYISGPVSPTLDSLIVVNGDATGIGGGGAANDVDAGGGVYVLDSAPTFLALSVFTGTAELGGGIYNHSGSPRFEALPAGTEGADPVLPQLRGNTAVSGGGFYNFAGQMTMDSVRVYANDAGSGGGIFNSGLITVANTLIYSNTAGAGGGVYNDTVQPARFYHLTVVSNTATLNGGGVYNANGDPVIRSSIFQGNVSPANGGAAIYVANGDADLDYNYYYAQSSTDVVNDTTGPNSIISATPPGLVGAGTDFHLLDDAPAIDAADPDSPILTDADGEPRPSNQGPDIGADEVVGCVVQLGDTIYGSIQAALDDAAPGETIQVAGECSGVHGVDTTGLGGSGACGDDFLATVHITKSVHLEGGWNTEFSAQNDVTYLNAQELGRVMYIGPGITSTVSNFHILNGAVSGNGGGVCIDSSQPLLQQNHIYSNTADNGAALYSVDSGAVIDGNRVFSNTATANGAIYVTGTGLTTTVQNNFIYLNTADNGGALYHASGEHPFWHNTVYSNTAANNGGGLYLATGSPRIHSNIVVSNTAVSGAGDGAYGETGGAAPTPDISHNDFFGQAQDFAGSLTNGGAGHLGVDPEFKNAANLNFAIPITSPVVDMGDPTLPITADYESDIRPSHQGFDMGADEVGGCFARVLSAPDAIYGSAADAVAAAPAGDTVQISGVCYGANEETLPPSGPTVRQSLLLDKDLTLDGNWNYEGAGPGVLDALGNGRVLYIRSSATVTVTQLTLQGGAAASGGDDPYGGNIFNNGDLYLVESDVFSGTANWGGGIYNASALTLEKTRVMTNTAVAGGGVYNNVSGTDPVALGGESEFLGNQADNGAAVYQNAGPLQLNGTKLYDNSAANDGGAVYLSGGTGSTLNIFNNFIYDNSAARGAGIFNENTNGRIWHNTILNNQGDGVYSVSTAGDSIHSNLIDSNSGVGLYTEDATPDIDYNNLWNNGSNYGGTAVGGGPNSISQPPIYVDRFEEDYHLQEGSPGEDEADPDITAVDITEDYDGDIRPTNQGPDIGADEINTCLIRVDQEIFGVLQEAINYAELNNYTDVEIARGACRGVQTKNGTEQVGYISENLNIIGSLRRSDFGRPSPSDFNNIEIRANSTTIDAQGEGRVLYIEPGAIVYLEHIVLVNGDAAVTDSSSNNGGGLYNPGGEIETSEMNTCANVAEDGGGYYGGNGSTAYFTGAGTGDCFVALFNDDDEFVGYDFYLGNEATSDGGAFYIAGGGHIDIVNHGIDDNIAGNRGGALYNVGSGSTVVINGIFVANQTSSGAGGAIYNASAGTLNLYHNTIVRNRAAGQGGGVYNTGTLGVNSSIVYSNTAASGGGGIHSASGGASDYNLFYINSPSNLDGLSAGTNSIFADPRLYGNVTLSRFSPAIDEADPDLLDTPILGFDGIDFDSGNIPRPDGPAPDYPAVASDIGADEYWKDAGCAVLPPNQEATVLPGDLVTYTVEIHNVGNPSYLTNNISHGYTDTITITLDSEVQGWSELEGGPEQTVTLDWFDSVARTLTVTVPADATTGLQEQSVVRCRSEAIPDRTDTANHTTNVGLVGGVLITPQYIDAAQPGAVLTYTHTITNIGNEADTFEIIPNAGAQGLSTAELVNQDPNITDTVTLDVNESITRELRVTILDTAAPDEVATPGLIVRSTTADPPVEGSVLNQITILPITGTRYVAIGGDDNVNNCRVAADPCATVQHAVDMAEENDAIRVAAGTYVDSIMATVGGDLVEQVVYVDKSVDIQGGYSVNDNFAVSQPLTNVTTLSGENARRVLFIADGITVTVSGFFIQDGRPYAPPDSVDERNQFGGGVYNNGANLTISSTQVLSNSAQVGGGLYHAGGDLTLASAVFAGNTNEANPAGAFGEGGGVFIAGGNAWLENNTFVDNRANIGGSLSSVRPTAVNADVNPSGNGGAVYYAPGGDLGLLNNIFAENDAAVGSAAYLSATTPITANYNIYFNNNGSETTFTQGADSFSADPLFEDSLYHIAATSPAKDAGTNQDLLFLNGVDFEGQPRLNSGTVDIGADERLQRPSFSFTPITQTATIDPGATVAYEHLLRNTGDTDDEYTLSIGNRLTPDDQPAWPYELTSSAGVTQNIYLDIGQEVTVTLVITGGDPGYVNTSIITATAVKAGERSVRDTTTISSTAGVDIAPDRSDSGDPGTMIFYTHTLTNTGNGVDQFFLRPITETATPSGWTVTVEPAQTTFLAAGATTTFTVSVQIPPGTPAATVHEIGVEATAQAPFARDVLTDTTTVLAGYGVALAPDNAQTVDAGGTVTYTHTLTNLGNITDTFNLIVDGAPADWTALATPAAPTLSGGEATLITVTVTAPPDAAGGLQHTAIITATSTGDPAQTATAVNTTTVRATQGVAIGPDNGPVIVDAGTTVTYTHLITNLGNVADTFTLDAASDQGWLDGFSPAEVTLAPQLTGAMIVTVTVPPGATPGALDTTTVTATSTADGTVFDTAADQTRVRQEHGVALTPNNTLTTTAPDTVVYTHILTNTGNGPDEFTFSGVSSEGWTVTPPPNAALESGAASSVAVTLTVPAGVGNVTDTMTLTATSVISPATSATVTNTTIITSGEGVFGVVIAPDNEGQGAPGQTVTYTHAVTNTGDTADSFSLSAGSNMGWPTGLSSSNVPLNAGESADIQVDVTIPAGATPGDLDQTTVTATSDTQPAISDTAVNTTTVIPGGDLIAVSIEPDNAATAAPGDTVTYNHVVTNTGTVAEIFSLTVASDQGWPVSVAPTSVNLAAGASEAVEVTLEVPLTAGDNQVDLTTVTATSSSDTAVSDTAVDTTTVDLAGALGVVIEPPTQVALGAPGDTVTYTHQVTNTGLFTDTYDLTAVSANWTAGVAPIAVQLAPGESAPLTVTVTITGADPINNGDTDITVITAASQTEPTVLDTAADTTVAQFQGEGVLVEPDNSAVGQPGETITYFHTLTNTSDATHSFLLETQSSLGWTVAFTPDRVDNLEAGMTVPITVNVTIPLGASDGQEDVTTVVATSLFDANVTDLAINRTRVLVPSYGVEIAPDNAATGFPGEILTYNHTVTNTGNVSDTITITATSDQGWTVTPAPSTLTLDAGENGSITVDVAIPAGAFSGTVDTATVTATSNNDAAATDTAVDVTTVEEEIEEIGGPIYLPVIMVAGQAGTPTYDVSITPDNEAIGFPGDTLTYEHIVTNRGSETDTVEITAASSQNWPIALSQSTLTLNAGQSQPLTIDVTVPAGAVAGTIDTTTVTAASTNDAAATDTAVDLTTVHEATGIDLIVTDIQVSPATPAAGEEATVSVTIKNQGDVDVPFGNNFYLDFYVDREPLPFLIGDIQWGVQGVLLEAGASVTYDATYTFGGGAHDLWAQVDTDDTVAEYPYDGNNVFGPEPLTVTGQQQPSEPASPFIYGPRSTPTPGP